MSIIMICCKKKKPVSPYHPSPTHGTTQEDSISNNVNPSTNEEDITSIETPKITCCYYTLQYCVICFFILLVFCIGIFIGENITCSYNNEKSVAINNFSLVSSQQIQNILTSYSTLETTNYILDTQYMATDYQIMQKIIKQNTVSQNTYQLENFDCDEFGIVMMSNIIQLSNQENLTNRLAFGLMTGYNYSVNERHLLNWFIDNNHHIWCVEPQTDHIHGHCLSSDFEIDMYLV